MIEELLKVFKVVNIMVLINSVLPDGSGELFTWIMLVALLFLILLLFGLMVFGREMFTILTARIRNNGVAEIPLTSGKKIFVELPKRAERYSMTLGTKENAIEKTWSIPPGSFRAYESGVWYTILHPKLPNAMNPDQMAEDIINNSDDGVMTPDEVDSSNKLYARRNSLRQGGPNLMAWLPIIALVGIILVAFYLIVSNAKPSEVQCIFDTVTTTTLGLAPTVGGVH